MSSNFLVHNINTTNKRTHNQIDSYQKIIQEVIKRKNKLNQYETNIINDINKYSINSQNKEELIKLEKAYKDSLFLLEAIQKAAEKKILKKYDLDLNNKKINLVKEIEDEFSMKKKFLIVSSPIFLSIQ